MHYITFLQDIGIIGGRNMISKIICKTLFTGEDIQNNKCVIIEDGKIKEVVDNLADININDGNENYECNFLMPGLIDAHVHITGYSEKYLDTNPYKYVENFIKILVSRGITSVRDMGNSIEAVEYAKKWGEVNYNIDIVYSGPILDSIPLTWASSRIISGEDDIDLTISKLKQEGIDFIKVYKNITLQNLKEITKCATKKGLKVAIDSPYIPTELQIEEGVYSIEHISNLFANYAKRNQTENIVLGLNDKEYVNKIIEILKKHGTYCCPTLLTVERLLNPDLMLKDDSVDFMIPIMPYHKYIKQMQNKIGGFLGKKYMYDALGIDEKQLKKYRMEDVIQKLEKLLVKLVDNDINILIGTDSPNPTITPGFSLHKEMELWNRAGVTEIDILRTVTAKNSVVINDAVGFIKKDMKANLLLLNSNPLRNINNIQDIKGVFVAGKFVDNIDIKL